MSEMDEFNERIENAVNLLTITRCMIPYDRYQVCVERNGLEVPENIEDHFVQGPCQQELENLKNCSEEIKEEEFISDLVMLGHAECPQEAQLVSACTDSHEDLDDCGRLFDNLLLCGANKLIAKFEEE